MEDRFTKFSKLYFYIFLLFLAVPVCIALVIVFGYGFSKLVSSKPFDIIYELLIMVMPAALFSTVYYIFFKRTKYHTAPVVKIISQLLFIAGFCTCVVIVTTDIMAYIKKSHQDITNYKSFTLWFLAGNVALLFFIAIIQALTTKKEEDWLTKRKKG